MRSPRHSPRRSCDQNPHDPLTGWGRSDHGVSPTTRRHGRTEEIRNASEMCRFYSFFRAVDQDRNEGSDRYLPGGGCQRTLCMDVVGWLARTAEISYVGFQHDLPTSTCIPLGAETATSPSFVQGSSSIRGHTLEPTLVISKIEGQPSWRISHRHSISDPGFPPRVGIVGAIVGLLIEDRGNRR